MHVTIQATPMKTQESKQIARFHLLTRNMFLIKIPSDICDTTSLTLIFIPFTAFCCRTSIINSHLFYCQLFYKSYFYFSSFRCWDLFQHWTFLAFIYLRNFLISHDIRNYQLCTFIICITP